MKQYQFFSAVYNNTMLFTNSLTEFPQSAYSVDQPLQQQENSEQYCKSCFTNI